MDIGFNMVENPLSWTVVKNWTTENNFGFVIQ
jgi:hypothetical protein